MPETAGVRWQKTACILCSLNCGIEVQVGGAGGRHLLKVKGDRDHPVSRGYFCEKAQRLDFYQTGGDRLDAPLRRRPDGTFEAIDWDTAIREVAAKFTEVKTRWGGDRILYYGGGGQGNHLGGSYGAATLAALGNRYRSNALAQEKTGEFWVNGRMIGAGTHGDFEHCEVAVFIGKNPWQSTLARARPRDDQRDGERPEAVDRRHRPPSQRDGCKGRLPSRDQARDRRVVPRRAGRDPGAGGPRAPRMGGRAHHGFRGDRAEVPGDRRARLRRLVRSRRGTLAAHRPPDRPCRERVRVRGPRDADVRPLDARKLDPAPHLAPHGAIRPQGHELYPAAPRRPHGRQQSRTARHRQTSGRR